VTVSYRAKIDAPLADGTPVTATGSVAARDVREFELKPAALTVTSPVRLDADETRFEVLTDDGSTAEVVTPGQRLTFRLTARNIGRSIGRELAGSVVLPATVVYAFGSLTLDGQPYPDPSRSPVNCAFGDLAPGSTTVMMLEAILASPLPSGRRLKAEAHLHWSQGEIRFERTLTVASQPRFDSTRNALSVSCSRTIAPGADVAYALTILNTGTVAASDAVLTITHDAGLEEIAVVDAGERRSLIDSTLVLGALAPQTPRNLAIQARAATPQPNGTELRLGAALTTSNGGDVDFGEQRHVIRSRPRFVASSSRLTRISQAPLRYGRVTAVAIELSNDGNDAARDVHVDLRLPEELKLEAVDEWPRKGNAIAFGDLAAGEARQAIVHLRLHKLVPRTTTVSFDGLVRARGSAPFSLDPLGLAVDAQPACADATFVSEPRETVAPGSQLAYTLSVRNTGDGIAAHLGLRVDACASMKFLPGSMSINSAALHDNMALSLFSSQRGLEMRDVAPGVDVIIRWLTIVDDPLAAGTVIEAEAKISLDGVPMPGLSSLPVIVGAVPAFPSAALQLPFSVIAVAAPQTIADTASSRAVEADDGKVAPRPIETSEIISNGSPARFESIAPALAAPDSSLPSLGISPPGPLSIETPLQSAEVDLRLTLTADWLVRALRFSRDVGNSPGLLRHIFAVRLFFPDGAPAGSRALQHSFDAERGALRSSQERLLLRLRQRHITVDTADLEQADGRTSCTALFSALREATAPGALEAAPRLGGSSYLTSTVSRKIAAKLAVGLAKAPLGSASPWFALAHLIGTPVSEGGEDDSASNYRAALLAALAPFEAMPPVRFAHALATHADPALDEVLDRFLRATMLTGPPPPVATAGLR